MRTTHSGPQAEQDKAPPPINGKAARQGGYPANNENGNGESLTDLFSSVKGLLHHRNSFRHRFAVFFRQRRFAIVMAGRGAP